MTGGVEPTTHSQDVKLLGGLEDENKNTFWGGQAHAYQNGVILGVQGQENQDTFILGCPAHENQEGYILGLPWGPTEESILDDSTIGEEEGKIHTL